MEILKVKNSFGDIFEIGSHVKSKSENTQYEYECFYCDGFFIDDEQMYMKKRDDLGRNIGNSKNINEYILNT